MMNFYKNISLFILVLLVQNVFSQMDFKKTDSISYALYSQQKWKELDKFGKIVKDYDYYYLNLRLGIADFNLNKFEKSIKYLKKALKNNSVSEVAKIYLYWDYYYLKNYKKSRFYYNQLDEKTKKQVKLNDFHKRIIDFVYLEGGPNKPQKNKDITLYGNLGLNHLLTQNFSLYQGYYFTGQNTQVSDYQLYRYYIKPTYSINNYDFFLNFNYSYLKYNYDFNTETNIQNEEKNVVVNGVTYDKISTVNQENTYKGNGLEKEFHINIGVVKLFSKFKAGVFGGIAKKDIKNIFDTREKGIENVVYLYQGNEVFNQNYPFDNEYVTKADSIRKRFNFGMIFGYNITKKIGFYTELETVLVNNKKEFNFVTSVSYQISEKLGFSLDFIRKGKTEYYYYANSILMNDIYKGSRIGLTSHYDFNRKISLFLVLQHDSSNNEFINKKYISNTILTGLKFRL